MLLDKWDEDNRVIDVGPTTTYSIEVQLGEWTWLEGAVTWITIYRVFKYTRKYTKRYRYVGMDKATALRCAEAMVKYYTRKTYVDEWQITGGLAGKFKEEDGGEIPMAEVVIRNVNATPMYEVEISVNETDFRFDTKSDKNPKTVFSKENNRTYDT